MSEPERSVNADGLHSRSRHRERYDFPALIRSVPDLADFVVASPGGAYGEQTIDFGNPAAVKALNRALLVHHYGITHWDIPAGYLCPPIPGRADYLHRVADLLAEANDGDVPQGRAVRVLDIGVAANCVFPIIGAAEYGWKFVGSDIDPIAVHWASQLVIANKVLKRNLECRLQTVAGEIFNGILKPGERFDLSICNPPFHSSREAAEASTLRKLKNLRGETSPEQEPVRNFGGTSSELWCSGGEAAFIRRMIKQSAMIPETCRWFTTLVSGRDNLPGIYKALNTAKSREVRTLEMNHGQKKTRIVAWSFVPPDSR
jgi:23S rRNA (adenine1618-N6)-methyltransferase